MMVEGYVSVPLSTLLEAAALLRRRGERLQEHGILPPDWADEPSDLIDAIIAAVIVGPGK